MRVFISWSKERSKFIAEQLRDWLPFVLQYARPFLSAHDIPSGGRWPDVLGEQLEDTNVGIICLTPENQFEPWIQFESGALSKLVTRSRLCVCLYGFDKPTDVPPPLGLFQLTNLADDQQLTKLILDLNSFSETKLDERMLSKTLEVWLPQLHGELQRVPKVKASGAKPTKPRDAEDMLEEILRRLRDQQTPQTRIVTREDYEKYRERVIRLKEEMTEMQSLIDTAPDSAKGKDQMRAASARLRQLEEELDSFRRPPMTSM